jgi:glycosyltransferase involved in cell wall biosynthesis
VEPPAIDVPDVHDRRGELRGSLDLRPGEQVAVVASRLVAAKRVDLAIAAVATLGRRSSPVRLVIVGDGPERAALEGRAAELDVAARFTGALPRREALGWIAASDVLVHPSAREGAPTVVREARALGVRVVACDAGDVARWAERDPGIAIAAPSGERIADAIVAALG